MRVERRGSMAVAGPGRIEHFVVGESTAGIVRHESSARVLGCSVAGLSVLECSGARVLGGNCEAFDHSDRRGRRMLFLSMGQPICAVAVASVLVASLHTSGKADSAPAPFLVSGAACNLATAGPDGVTRLYWQLYDLTELCVTVDVMTTPPTSVSLSFVLVYQGRETTPPPVSTLVRAHTNTTTGLVEPTFQFRTPRGALVLVAPQRDYQLTYPCDRSQGGCAFDGAVASISRDELLELSDAETLAGHALGADFTVTSTGLGAIRTLAAFVRKKPA